VTERVKQETLALHFPCLLQERRRYVLGVLRRLADGEQELHIPQQYRNPTSYLVDKPSTQQSTLEQEDASRSFKPLRL